MIIPESIFDWTIITWLYMIGGLVIFCIISLICCVILTACVASIYAWSYGYDWSILDILTNNDDKLFKKKRKRKDKK